MRQQTKLKRKWNRDCIRRSHPTWLERQCKPVQSRAKMQLFSVTVLCSINKSFCRRILLGSRNLRLETLKLEAGSSKLETRSSKLETRASKLELREIENFEDRVSSFESRLSTYLWPVLYEEIKAKLTPFLVKKVKFNPKIGLFRVTLQTLEQTVNLNLFSSIASFYQFMAKFSFFASLLFLYSVKTVNEKCAISQNICPFNDIWLFAIIIKSCV